MSEAFDAGVTIANWTQVVPWSVARCELRDPPAGVPGSVIVKWVRESPTDFRTEPQRLCTERAALEFVADLGLELAPRLLASKLVAGEPVTGELVAGELMAGELMAGEGVPGESVAGEPVTGEGATRELAAGFLVLEDLSPRVPLADLIRRNGAKASAEALLLFARSLGELNAATAGHADVYYARRRTYGPVDPHVERLRFVGRADDETRRVLEVLGVPMQGGAEREWAAVLAAMAEPGPFLTFSNGDAGANNFLVDGDDGRLTDFESAGFRHAVTDAAGLAVPGPMWITVSDPVASGLEAAYRAALAEGVPEAADDRVFGHAMAASCLVMGLERLGGFARVDGRPEGDGSRVQRIFTLELAADTAERHRCFPHLTGWFREVAQLLRRRWKDADVDIATYPPYAPRT